MTEPFDRWLATVFNASSEPATEAKVQSVELRIGYRLPDEVRRVLVLGNRPEGFVGDSYIAFLNGEDLIQCWLDAQASAGGFVPFASNGGGEWYGLDSRQSSPAFLLMPAIGMEWEVAMFLGGTWNEFWNALERGNLFAHRYQPAKNRSLP
jgi:hypothetical protein